MSEGSRSPARALARLGGAVAAGGLAAWAFAIEPFRLTVTHHRVRLRPEGSDGAMLRLVQLTDLHLRSIGRREKGVLEIVTGLAPDVIVITGDVIERSRQRHLLERFVDLLPRDTPLYAVPGNWDHRSRLGIPALRESFGRNGGILLVNESVVHRHQGRDLLLTGIDDLAKGHPDLDAAFAGTVPHDAHIVLAHCPAHRDILRAWLATREGGVSASPRATGRRPGFPPVAADENVPRPRLLLAGHTHGGQVRLFGWAPVLPRASGRYAAGWYRDFLPHMYVSQGIGTSLAPLRFGASPEIAVFELEI